MSISDDDLRVAGDFGLVAAAVNLFGIATIEVHGDITVDLSIQVVSTKNLFVSTAIEKTKNTIRPTAKISNYYKTVFRF